MCDINDTENGDSSCWCQQRFNPISDYIATVIFIKTIKCMSMCMCLNVRYEIVLFFYCINLCILGCKEQKTWHNHIKLMQPPGHKIFYCAAIVMNISITSRSVYSELTCLYFKGSFNL